MITDAEMLAQIEAAFPFVARPALPQISFHNDDCAHCEMTRKFLHNHENPELPAPAIRYLFDEMSTLSPKATAWVLPSYLRYVVTNPQEMDMAIEMLIYNLGPQSEHEAETKIRLSLLTTKQLDCLLALIRFWGYKERWSEYCSKDLTRAELFVQKTLASESVARRARRLG